MEGMKIALLEAYTDALNRVKTSRAGRTAVSKWSDSVDTRDGELELINAAKAGDGDARLYLFIHSIPQLGSSLKKFLGPDPRASRARISNGDAEEFVSEATILLNTALEKWDPDKVNPEKSLLNDFAMWIMNSTMSRGTILNRAKNKGYISGKVGRDEPPIRMGSYEAQVEDEGETIAASYGDVGRGTVLLDAWGSFAEDTELDSGKEPTPRSVLKFFLDRGRFDVEEASEEFGKTMQTIRTRLASLGPILDRHGVSYDDFLRLIKDNGGRELANIL